MKPERILGIVIVLLLALPLSVSGRSDAENKSITLTTKEVSLGKFHPGGVTASIVVSPDSKRVAYGAQEGGKQLVVVVVDAQEGKAYDGIPDVLIFSPDSKRVAYVAAKGGKRLVVVDGQEGSEYDVVGTVLIFSPDSKRVAYAAQKGGKWLVVVDGQEGREYDVIGAGTLIFSPDSRRVAYGAQKGEKWLVVVDGQEGNEYDGFLNGSKLVFDSSDSLHILALVLTGAPQEIFRVEIKIAEK